LGTALAATVIGTIVGTALDPASPKRLDPNPSYVSGQALVRFSPDSSATDRAAALARAGAHRLRRLPLPRGWVVGLDGVSVEDAVAELAGGPGVEYAEPNGYLRPAAATNDPLFPRGATQRGGQAELRAIRVPKAWRLLKGDHHKVTVAVADTGVALDHPDLRKALWRNHGELGRDARGRKRRANGRDDDDDNKVDDWRGWDFAPEGGLRFCEESHFPDPTFRVYPCTDRDGDHSPDPAGGGDNYPFDLSGHGTHVAGTIGAVTGNRLGIASVGENRVRIMALRTGLERLSAEYTANAIAYAREKGADVVNLSLSLSTTGSQTLTEAIRQAKGVLFVAAAGNGARGTNNDEFGQVPCTVDETDTRIDNLVCVAATNSSGHLARYSNYGPQSVDLAAPGRTLSTETPRRRSMFQAAFKRGLHGWRTGGVNDTWGREDSTLSDSPGAPYDPEPPIDSWARTPRLHLDDMRGCVVGYDLQLETEPAEAQAPLDDYLSLEVSHRRDFLRRPRGLAVDSVAPHNPALPSIARLYVTDGRTLQVFAENGAHLAELTRGRPLGRLGGIDLMPLDTPPGAAPQARLWIAGAARSQIYKMHTDGSHLKVFDESGPGPGRLVNPTGIAVGKDPATGKERVYVADTGNNRIKVLSARGRLKDVWHGFDRPHGVDVDPQTGRVFIADTGAHEVEVIDPSDDEERHTWQGPSGNFDPTDVAVSELDPSGGPANVAVTDRRHDRVFLFDASGNPSPFKRVPGAAGIDRLDGLTWVATSGGIRAYDPASQAWIQIKRWGLEIDLRSGDHSGRATAQIPPGFGGRVYLRFRFRNQESSFDPPPFDGARIDDLQVRCATGNYRRAYGYRRGTSFAAPLVSGVAALYLSQHRRASPADVIRALRRGVDDRPRIPEVAWEGEVDAAATLRLGQTGRRPMTLPRPRVHPR
jgi:subtilisin family serine protease